jgi:hypothetical protein
MSKKTTAKERAAIDDQALTSVIDNDHALTVLDPYQDVKDHSKRIKASWQKAVSSIIETGQFLQEARDALRSSGRFLKLFDKEIGNLPFSKDTAQRLMKIAKHPVLSNTAYTPLLPACWYTLAILSRADPDQLERWLADGSVHAQLQQVDAIALVNPVKLPAPSLSDDASVSDKSWEQQPTKTKEAEQLSLELKEGAMTRRQNNETAVQKLDYGRVVQQLKSFCDKLCNPEFGWNDVIDAAGEALIRDIINELTDRLANYKQAKAGAAAKAAVTVH